MAKKEEAFIHIDINKSSGGMQPHLKAKGISRLETIAVLCLMQRSIENELLRVVDEVKRIRR